MKHVYQNDIKPFIRDEILSTAKELGLSQEKAAEILGIEPRSYAYLKVRKRLESPSTIIIKHTVL